MDISQQSLLDSTSTPRDEKNHLNEKMVESLHVTLSVLVLVFLMNFK